MLCAEGCFFQKCMPLSVPTFLCSGISRARRLIARHVLRTGTRDPLPPRPGLPMVTIGLAAGCLSGWTPRVLATSIEAYTLTNALVDPECTPPPTVPEFLTGDARATVWIGLHDVRVGDTYTYTWYDPTGKVFHRHTLVRDEEDDDSCTWNSITLRGGLASTRPGIWRIQFAYNGLVQLDQRFVVAESGRIEAAALTTALPDLNEPDAAAPASMPVVAGSEPAVGLNLRLRDLRASDTYGVRWIDPAGKVALQQLIPVEQELRRLNAWCFLPLKTAAGGPLPGRWRVDIFVDGLPRRTLPFVVRPEQPAEVRGDLKADYGDGAADPCSPRSNPIEQRLLPRGGRRYRDPTQSESDRMVAVLDALADERYEVAASLAQTLQLTLNRHIDSETEQVVWVLEPALPGAGPGYGVLVFYRPDGDPGLIAEIARPGHDDRTVDFGIELLRQGASMLLVSGADVSANYRPTRRLEQPLCAVRITDMQLVPGLDDSNVMLNDGSMFQRVHAWATDRAESRQLSPMVVQFFGLPDEVRASRTPATRGCDHTLILTNGVGDQVDEPPLLVELSSQLGRSFLRGPSSNRRYDVDISVRSGRDCSALGIEQAANVQARLTLEVGGAFVGVALDEEIRSYPTDVDARQVAEALWETYLGHWREGEAGGSGPLARESAPIHAAPQQSAPANRLSPQSAPPVRASQQSAPPVRSPLQAPQVGSPQPTAPPLAPPRAGATQQAEPRPSAPAEVTPSRGGPVRTDPALGSPPDRPGTLARPVPGPRPTAQ